ncbi:MAG: tandem-95 repeat protein [Flavobacteriales bacterium]|nr:tandem-95 repeat protein [Flavobacteriales bacterium]
MSGGTASANGTLLFNANGTFNYTPDANFNGPVTFTYQACDPSNACDPATVTITVNPVNDPPVANDDTFTMNEDASLAAQSVTGNDSDSDNTNAQLVWSLISGGTATANGTLAFNANGTFNYTPNANYNGTVSFTYQACDPSAACDQATVTITINALNDGPTANDDNFSVAEDGTLSTTVSGNDSDPDNTAAQLTWSILSGGTAAANGSLSFNSDGTFIYAPDANFSGSVSFTYQLCDPSNACDPATVTITVSPVNDAPIANDDSFSMNEDGMLMAQSVTGNDSDTETANGSLVWSLVNGGTAAANGTLVFNANGTFNYTPTANFNGSVSFTYQVCDPGPLCDNATVTITVNAVNDTPVANDDTFNTAEDVAVSNTVGGNDSDADNTNGQLTWTLLSGGTAATNGTLNFNNDGTFTWTPNANFNGSVSFTYTLCDPSNACDNETVTINVGGTNDTPVANDDGFSTPEDNTLNANVTGNDTDADGDVLTFTVVSGGTAAANGVLTLNANGSFSYVPNANFNGAVSFTYQACDPSNACDPAAVVITVTPVNDAPVANDDPFTTNEDVTLSGTVGGNDSDTETANAGLVWSLVNGGTAAANGSLVLNVDGTFTYTPGVNFNGSVSFTYQVCDPSSACDPAIVTITVTPVNDTPVANDDSFTMAEDGALAAQSITGNDSDTETANAALTWSLVSGGTAAANGTLVFNVNGSFDYTPNTDYTGTVSFTYQLCDPGPLCDNATVTITVDPVNDTPTAGDEAFTMNEDGTLTGQSVNGNDSDTETANALLTWSLVSGGTAATNGTLVFNADGTFNYTPNADFNGAVTFTYQVCDPSNACDPATVTITVNPVNDTPVANDDGFTMNEDVTLVNSVGGNDSDIDNTNAQLTWSLVSGGTAAASGTLQFNADGTFTYSPNADFTGSVSFTYQLCDLGSACDNALVTINVTAVNDQPVANDDGFTMNEDGTLTAQSVTGNDSDPDNTNGQLTWALLSGGGAAVNGALTFNTDGTFNYVPNGNFNGSVSFTYQVCDPSNACDPATVTIVVNAVNDGPIANDDIFGVIEDATLVSSVTGNDSDIDHTNGQLSWSLVSGGTAESNGAVTFNADGTFTYVPDAGFNGSVSFTYQVCDPGGLCDAAEVTILVGSDNDAPIAGDDDFLTNEDNAINSAVTGGDSDPDGDMLTWNLVSGGTAAVNGTLVFNADGSFSWTPNADYNGVVSFTYEVCDPLLFCDGGTVTITVLPVNDAPVANDDNFTIPEDGSLSNTVSGNDSDVDSPLTWTLLDDGSAGDNGVLVFNPDGTFTWMPNVDFNGSVSFTYQACDAEPLCDEAIVTIDATPSNDAPVANDDAFTMNEDASLSGTVADNDSDADNTTGQLTWGLVSGGTALANGSLTLNANGSFTYVPNANFNGTVSFLYEVCDPTGACDPAVVSIFVSPVNDAPFAGDDAFSVDEDVTVNASLAGNDGDVDGDALTWSLLNGSSAAANGTLTVDPDGAFSFVPNAGFNGVVSFTYQVCDPSAICDPALVVITVGAVNDPPAVIDDNTDTNEDTPVIIDVLANDSDSDGDIVESSVTITIQPSHGTVTVNLDGSIIYTPFTDYVGVDAFAYQVCDDGTPLPAECGTAFVDINVLPLNDGPTAFDDGYSFLEDGGTLTSDAGGNDYDIDDLNNTLTWNLFNGGTAAQNGTIVFNADGTFSYTPNANYYGFVSFTYQVCDPSGLCEGATIFIDVLPVNDPPVALGDLDNVLPNSLVITNVSANDNDTTDVSTLDLGSITIIVGPDSGTVIVNGNGTLTYTPNPGFVGNDTLIYQICDVGVPLPALCDTAILVILVTNAYPLAVDDNFSLPEDSTLTMDVLDNDTTITGVILPSSVVVVDGPFNGTATVNPDGTISYVPGANYNGPDAFTYTICTDLGFCSNGAVLIFVDPVNDPPVAVNDTTSMDEDADVIIDVLVNDNDFADGSLGGIDPTSTSVITSPANGTATVNVDGSITYTPNANFNGVDSLVYQVCDVGYPLPAQCDSALVIITVGPVNDGPVITDGNGTPIDTITVSTPEDVPLQICFTATDPENDTLDATNSFLGPDFGVITGESDGDTCITYTPDPNYNGGDTVTVVVCDNNGLCDTVVVLIDVTPVNDPPQVVDVIGDPIDTVSSTTPEDTPITICLDVIDIDGDPVEVSGVLSGPQIGSVTELADGDTCFLYTPDPDLNGVDTLQLLVCDNNGGCDTLTVIIDVTPVNDPPVIGSPFGAYTDTLTIFTLEDLAIDICIEAVDVDGDTLEVISVPYGPFTGTATNVQNGDTCLTYTPDPSFIGTDTLIAVVSDGNGGTDTLVVIIQVLEQNDPPVIVDGGGTPIDTLAVTTPEDTPIQICLDAIDPEGFPVDATNVLPIVLNGFINGLADGDTCITYTPLPNYNGIDSIYVFVCDGFNACDSVLVIITVTPTNDPPVITDPGFVSIDTLFVSTEVNTATTVCLTALDIDGDTLDVTAILNGPLNGLADSFNDGDTCFVYTPNPSYVGGDTLTAVVCDNSGACDTVLVIIDVTGVNTPPIIVDGNFSPTDTLTYTTPEDQAITICITAIDLDGDTLDITGIFGGPVNGSANGIADGDTCFTYTPNPDWNGSDTVNVIVCDNNGGCDTVLVIIDVTPVNDPPIIIDGGDPVDTLNTTTPQDIPIVICLDAIDVDGDTLDVTVVVDPPGNGTVSGIANGDSCFTYTPDPGFTGSDTVTVVLCDNAGACDTVTVIIGVTPVTSNDPPIAVDDVANTDVDTPVTVVVLTNDSDPNGDPITVTGASASNGTVVINGDGSITYTPSTGFCGTDTIFYTICDPGLLCDNAIVVVTVDCPPVNDPPIAVDDVANTDANTPITVVVLTNDSDPNGDPITVTGASASNGTVVINGDGSITYTPSTGFCGTDTIFYTICDPEPLCDNAIVVVTVECPPVNDPPIAVDDSTGTEPDTPLLIDVLDNDSDPNGDPLTVTSADASNGTVVINSDGTLSYTPTDGFCGVDTITYVVCDQEPLCDGAFVFITIECPDTTGLLIPQGFSPNNDGFGDTWTITGLDKYPLAKVTIFNRWGNEVYSAEPYGNDWDGRSTNSLTWDGVLPVGTYWYLLDLGVEGEEVRTGYIYLNR